MFQNIPKMMNDNNFYTTKVARKDVALCTMTIPIQWGSSSRSGTAATAVGLACLFMPLAGVLVLQPVAGGWWILLVLWTFVWPHLAWQLAARSSDPYASETHNLKADALLAGMWMGLIGVNLLPSIAAGNGGFYHHDGAGGPRLCLAGVILMVVACLVTLQLTGITTPQPVTDYLPDGAGTSAVSLLFLDDFP
jgi:diguanylate cyclase